MLSADYYQRLYDLEDQHWWFQGTRAIGQALLDVYFKGKSDLKVLDAGCGTGVSLGWLERYTRPEAIFGIDITALALQFCLTRQYKQLALASVLELPFPAASFDLVISADVLQHLSRQGGDTAALREMSRVIKPGGILYVRTNTSKGVGQVRAEVDSSYQRYDQDELTRKFEATGFVIERVTYINMLMSAWGTVKRKAKNLVPAHHEDHQPHDNNSPGHQHSHEHEHNHNHNHDRGLAVKLPRWRFLNRSLFGLMKLEALYLAKPGRQISFGHSQIFILRKSIQPEGLTDHNGESKSSSS